MKLSTWIENTGGTAKAGAILGVARNCVYAWREGVALPRPLLMAQIVRQTRGKVSYAEMIEEHLEIKKQESDKLLKARAAKKPAVKKKPKNMRGQNSGPARSKRLIETVAKLRKQKERLAKKKTRPLGF